MRKTRRVYVVILTLVLMTAMMPLVMADDATNEAIEYVTITFEGEGNSTIINIFVGLNDIADSNSGLIVKFWVNEKTDSALLGQTVPGGNEYSGTWDITEYAEGYYTLICELTETDETIHDNKADNRLDVPFVTQDWFYAPLGEMYGYLQITWSKFFRQNIDGSLSFMDSIPLWIWLVVFLAIIVILLLWRRSRRKNSRIKGYVSKPVYYVKDNYRNW